MPARSRSPGFGSSMRTRSVRLSRVASGSTAATLPRCTSPGSAAKRSSAVCPLRTAAASASGTAASTHTVPRPLMRASVMPAATVMPWRTISSLISPPIGARTVLSASGWPLCSTRSTSAAGMPNSVSRSRAAAVSAASPVRRTARYSVCAASQSGCSTSAKAAPAPMTSPGARACTRSTKPLARACTMATSRSFRPTLPTTSTTGARARFSAVATRNPSDCCACGDTLTPVGPSVPPSSA